LSATDDGRNSGPENGAPFDLTRLSADERQLWDDYCADGWEDAPVLAVWSFGHICMLAASGPPDVVVEYLDEHDPDSNVQQYLDNVRRKRDEGRP
jgi:hypothetical protein